MPTSPLPPTNSAHSAWAQLRDDIARYPISQIIQHYLPLVLKGKNWEGLCPFHPDSKPSLKVTDEKGLYKCFACSAGGDAITFVKEFKKISFKEAVTEIAGQLNLNLPTATVSRQAQLLRPYLELMNKVQLFFQRQEDRDYVSEKQHFLKQRHLDGDVAASFGLVYVPRGNKLTQLLSSAPEELSLALELGLIKQNQESPQQYYDTFRDRLLFPLQDERGQWRAYSSRALREDQVPKYLNSPESKLFHKKEHFYGLFQAQESIRRRGQAILAEGHMDVVMLHQKGFQWSLGLMGTALGAEQVAVLKRKQVQRVFLLLDEDRAGVEAKARAFPILVKAGIQVYDLSLLPHKDPDEFLKQEGSLALEERLKQARPYVDVMIEKMCTAPLGDHTDLKVKVLEEVMQLLLPLAQDLGTADRLKRAASHLNLSISFDLLWEKFQEQVKPSEYPHKKIGDWKILTPELPPLQEALPPVIEDPIEALPAPIWSGPQLWLLEQLLLHHYLFRAKNFTDMVESVKNEPTGPVLRGLSHIYGETDREYFLSTALQYLKQQGVEFGKRLTIERLLSENRTLAPLQGEHDPEMMIQMWQELKHRFDTLVLKEKRRQLKAAHLKARQQQEIDELLKALHALDRELFLKQTSLKKSTV